MIPNGAIAATLVGYNPAGALDLDLTGAHYRRLIERGIDGLFIGGSTGESFLLSHDERASILEHAHRVLGNRVPWIAHVGSMTTTDTVELARLADESDAAAISVITPIYFALDAREHADHFRAIARAVRKPVVAYHIPARTGVDLGPDFFVELAQEGVIDGLKYTSTDLFPLAEVIRRTEDRFAVFNGSDEVLTGGLALGAHGGIGSTYTILPETYSAISVAVSAGDLATARFHQDRANTVIAQMQNYNFLAFLRAILLRDGVDLGPSRLPLPGLTPAEQNKVTTWASAHADLFTASANEEAHE